MKNLIKYVFILFVFMSAQTWAQQDQFLIGAYMHSSFNQDTAKYSFWRAKQLGINTPIVYAQRTHIDDDPQINYIGDPSDVLTNLDLLQDFDNVIAINYYSSYKVLDGSIPNYDIRNFDWIYFYSGAYYSKWDATIATLPGYTLGLNHEFGETVEFNGKTYWSSGTNPAYINQYLVKGPNYLQETRYRSSAYPDILKV